LTSKASDYMLGIPEDAAACEAIVKEMMGSNVPSVNIGLGIEGYYKDARRLPDYEGWLMLRHDLNRYSTILHVNKQKTTPQGMAHRFDIDVDRYVKIAHRIIYPTSSETEKFAAAMKGIAFNTAEDYRKGIPDDDRGGPDNVPVISPRRPDNGPKGGAAAPVPTTREYA
jgi:hypothetical protein